MSCYFCFVLFPLVLCCSVNVSVCFVCCVFDSVCELFGETICNMFGETICNMFWCVCYFVVECDGVVECGWRYSIGKECVCCACGPSERLDAPSICFVCIFVCQKLSPHLGV